MPLQWKRRWKMQFENILFSPDSTYLCFEDKAAVVGNNENLWLIRTGADGRKAHFVTITQHYTYLMLLSLSLSTFFNGHTVAGISITPSKPHSTFWKFCHQNTLHLQQQLEAKRQALVYIHPTLPHVIKLAITIFLWNYCKLGHMAKPLLNIFNLDKKLRQIIYFGNFLGYWRRN